MTVEIYRDNNPASARSLRVSIYNGTITMVEQDYGELVRKMFGDSDIERFLSSISADEVKKALMVSSDEQLEEALKTSFGSNDGFDRFAAFLKSHNIGFRSGSY